MDIDSDSSDETSGDDYTTESSDDDGMETAEIDGVKLQLPQGMCEKKDIFHSILSMDTWNTLSNTQKEHLNQFLPNFPSDIDKQEKNVTLEKLFNCENFRFSNPLEKFHNDLKAGYFRPDIANIKRMIKKAERKEALYRYRRYREKLKQDIIESQRKLLEQMHNLPPGVEPKSEKINNQQELFSNYVIHRTKRRYFQILTSIQTKTDENYNNSSSGHNNYCSPDENYPEGPPVPLSRKQRRHLNSIRNAQNGDIYISTMSTKSNLDLEKYITPTYNPFYITDETYRSLVNQHKRRKIEHSDAPEYNTKGITISDIISRTQLPYLKTTPVNNKNHDSNNRVSSSKKKIKKEIYHHHHRQQVVNNNSNYLVDHSSNSEVGESDSDSFVDTSVPSTNHIANKLKNNKPNVETKVKISNKNKNDIKKEIQQPLPVKVKCNEITNNLNEKVTTPSLNNYNQFNKVTPVQISELENIDMMSIPIDLDNTDIDIIEFHNNKPELMQETHANFLSLIRDIICSTTEHRMNFNKLEDRLKSWQENPISPLNDWYSLNDNWVKLLKSAVNFLCGNLSDQPDGFVPYMEYKLQLDMFQWIGAGRDSDNLLAPLCQYWLEHRNNDIKSALANAANYSAKEKTSQPAPQQQLELEVISDRSQTPPPPRCPTTWTVRKATPEEIKEFRQQEKIRYDNPHKAFTYRSNGYESVVGPLKGIYNPAVGNTKARGHTMLNADRPNFVTILSLVRDATARLPNGEGTRADICELLKSSQYISSTAPENVLQSVVSGALDRMHTQFDPCVKYDPKRKNWIYLHRNRTEEDFERIHQQYQSVNKSSKKSSSRKSSSSTSNATNNSTASNTTTATTTSSTISKSKSSRVENKSSGKASSNKVNQDEKPSKISPKSNRVKLLTTTDTTNTTNKSNNSLLVSNQDNRSIVEHQEKTTESLLTTQNRASPTIVNKTTSSIKSKNFVKILSPNHGGKSLIIPSSQQNLIKQATDQRSPITTKQLNQQPQLVTQQLIQTLTKQSKSVATAVAGQIQITKSINSSTGPDDGKDQKTTVQQQQQQQFIQSISSQQLQNIKNVTLVRNIGQVTSGTSQQIDKLEPQQQQIQIKTQTALTAAQQQQIIQTIKQRMLPQAQIINPQQQQQIMLKQKALAKAQSQAQAAGTSLLGQSKITEVSKTGLAANQTPVVAKVLTNAAGQVISVESLLAHQKQHGSLPQGTTLRVSSGKGGQTNIIQLAGTTSKSTPQLSQFAVASQNNIIALTTSTNNQPKLVVASQSNPTSQSLATSTGPIITTTTVAVKPISRVTNMNKTPTLTAKFTPKITQQLINAKLITTQNLEGQKIQVQPKIFVGHQNQVKINPGKGLTLTKPVTLSVAANSGNTIRMVNATNLNLTHIAGKPVLLASKGTAIQNLQGQNVILQTQTGNSGNNLVIQNPNIKTNLVTATTTVVSTTTTTTTTTTATTTTSATTAATATVTSLSQNNSVNVINQQNVTVFGGPVKVQAPQQIVFSSNVKNVSQTQGQHIVLEGHPVRLQTTTAANTQRVVLASQGQGGQILAQQILLPAGFQGTAINIKALQGVKVIPLAQAQGRGISGRQFFARVMSPNVVKTGTTTSNNNSQIQEKLPDPTITTTE